jgi:hypothetical protein
MQTPAIMKKPYNVQFRKLNFSINWDHVFLLIRSYCKRYTAVNFAKRLLKLLNVDVLMTVGKDHITSSAFYFSIEDY